MAENNSFFQPELELNLDRTPKTPAEPREPHKFLFTGGLATSLDGVWEDLTQSDQLRIHLEPRTSEDPFYLAQVRARELETLTSLDHVPVLSPGLPFDQAESTSSELIGLSARDELNRRIPPGVRNNRLAISTFNLTALEHPSLKRYGHYGDDEMIVSGLFTEFIFAKYGKERTLVVPLAQPRILFPKFLRDMKLSSVTMPVLDMGNWDYDKTA